MGPQPKFNFVPERQLVVGTANSEAYRVSLYAYEKMDKQGRPFFVNILLWPKEVVDIYDLKDKYVRFYGDREKKVIGWSIVEKAEDFAEMKDLKIMRASSQGVVKLAIKRLLDSLGVEIKEHRKNLQVKTYESPLNSHKIYYVKL